MKRNVLIAGAAGRDFHNFNMFFRENENYNVAGFTATQIPDIAGRKYPAALAGKLYPKGIPIYEEKDLEKLIRKLKVDEVYFSYSDVSHEYVMHLASRAQAAGASFMLLGPNETMLKSKKRVIAVCAVRTGAGKSPLTRKIAGMLKKANVKTAIIRHPMPYGDLAKQAVQRFASLEDLDRHHTTIEEREDYEPHIREGFLVFAGVDYAKVLKAAEKEADVILWDGGNNDMPFLKPDLMFTVADALRPWHELLYYPGETNFRMADVIVINKADRSKDGVKKIRLHAEEVNPKAEVVEAKLILKSDDGESIKGKNVIVVEDGPTVTHGGMKFGAGHVFAEQHGASIINPLPYATGSIKEGFKKYRHLEKVLPAMGYSKKQVAELQKTINSSKADVVVSGTPADIRRIIKVKIPYVQVGYDIKEMNGKLEKIMKGFLKG